MRRRLQAQRDRTKQRDLKEVDGLSEEEKKAALATQQTQLEADRQREDNTVLQALQALERVKLIAMYMTNLKSLQMTIMSRDKR